MPISNSSRIGDVAEFLFDARAVEHRLIVNRPIHAGTIYDRVVECGGKFFKVQIKCVTSKHSHGGYNVVLMRGHKSKFAYTQEDVDVFAVYVMPEDSWYIFYNDGQKSIYISKGNFKEYRNNWSLFYEAV